MKILIVTNMWPIPSHQYYGIFVKEQIECLEKNYSDLHTDVFFINGKKNKFNYLLSIFKINWKLLNNKYDVIHIHFGLSGLFVLFNPFINIPIITTLHSADIDIVKSTRLIIWISKQVIKRSKKVFYLNDKMLDILSKFKEKLIYLPCGVNTEDFYEEHISRAKNIISIGFPANINRPEKNYKLFNEIIKQIENELNQEINIVEFHNKTRLEVRKSLNSINLLIMTSLSEGSPQIIKEALSCNTPIISSNVGDVEKLLKGVENCFLVDSFSPVDYTIPALKILTKSFIQHRSNGRKQIFKLSLDEKSISDRIYSEYLNLMK
jgi:glycosyltransferase involved in cell wall biosynthesis